MARLLHSLLLGLIGAVIVHIAILLLIPLQAPDDAWSRLEAAGPPWRFFPVEGAAAAADPLMVAFACRFDLTDGVARVVAEGRPPHWSASIHNRRGRNLYSLTDRTNPDRRMDFVLATPAQMIELRQELTEEFAGAIFVEIAEPLGFMVLRAFRPDDSFAPVVDRFLASARCTPA